MAKKKGLISRLIEGPERSESYARTKLPTNRWQLGWDVFTTNFSKLIFVNLLILLFALPLIAIIFFRSTFISAQALQFPFSANLGIGYPALGNMQGLEESIVLSANWTLLIFLPVAAIVLSVGISGGMYIMRNLVWTEGVFVGSDFWRGVKKNFGVVLFSLLLYSIFMLLSIMSVSMADYMIKAGSASEIWLTVAKVMTYVAMGFITIMVCYMLSIGVTYQLKFHQLIRNAFLLTIALLPTNIFFILLAAIPFILAAIINVIGYFIIIILGISYALLVWTTYTQWVFDKFINDKVPGAKKNRGIYEKVDSHGNPLYGTEGFDASAFDTAYLNKRPVKPVTDYDIELVELPQSFTREDLRRLEESKEAMRRDSDEYVKEKLAEQAEEEARKKAEEEELAAQNSKKKKKNDTTGDNADSSDGSESPNTDGGDGEDK